MFFLKSNKSPLSLDDEEWQLACWPWLLEHVIDLETVRQCQLIVPTDEFFPPTPLKDKERAAHVFQCVAELSGVGEWPFDLIEQEQSVNPLVAPLLAVQNAPNSPLGTFSLKSDYRLQITYNPDLLDQPIQLIATYAHEICHALMLTANRNDPDTELPGGWECEEFATDLLVVLLGFGVFGANSAFEFQQYTDMATGTQGWSTRRNGYLTEAEWAFGLATYLRVTGQSEDVAKSHLKPALFKQLSQSLAYLDKNHSLLSWANG